MTVKELIIQLLDCDVDKEICIADDVEFEDENGKVIGSLYDITSVYESGLVCLKFDNRNHRSRGGTQHGIV